MTQIAGRLHNALVERQQQQRLRQLRVADPLKAHLSNFSSNDYLGLSQHPRVVKAYTQPETTMSIGSTASPLVVGHTRWHAYLTQKLAELLGREQVLLFSSAFSANVGLLRSLAPYYEQVLLDRLAHASLIDGAKSIDQTWRRFRHNDIAHLRQLLDKAAEPQLVISETVFSMDGDTAPITELVASTAGKHDLWLDDAHGFGLCGRNGLSCAGDFTQYQVPYITLAFGKACGVAGGAIAADQVTADYLTNYCREFIYSTAMPPRQAAAVQAAVEVIASAEGDTLRAQLQQNIADFRRLALAAGLPVGPDTHAIQTLRVGADDKAVAISQQLLQAGIQCVAIRPPTVPEGSARLRITVTARHTEAEIQQLVACLTPLVEHLEMSSND